MRSNLQFSKVCSRESLFIITLRPNFFSPCIVDRPNLDFETASTVNIKERKEWYNRYKVWTVWGFFFFLQNVKASSTNTCRPGAHVSYPSLELKKQDKTKQTNLCMPYMVKSPSIVWVTAFHLIWLFFNMPPLHLSMAITERGGYIFCLPHKLTKAFRWQSFS